MLLKAMEQATSISSCSRNPARAPDENGMEQVLSDLQALKGLYGLLHRGQANENLDDASRALLMRMLDNATQQALLRQAKMLSGPLMSPALERKLSIQPGDRRPSGADAGPRLMPVPSPSLSIHASERSRLLMPQSSVRSRYGGHMLPQSSVRSRDGGHMLPQSSMRSRDGGHMLPQSSLRSRDSRRVYDDHRGSARYDHHLLGRVASNRSSRIPAMPRQRLAPLADLSDRDRRPRVGSGRGDRSSSLERSSSSRHRQSSVSRSRAPSALGMARRRGSSTRRFRKLEDSGLFSVGVMSRRGSVRGTRRSSSSSSEEDDGAAVTTRSRVRPNDERTERRGLLRDEESEEEPILPRRRRKEGSVSVGRSSRRNRPRRTLDRIDSCSTYNSSRSVIRRSSSGATSPTASPSTSGAPAPCYSSSSSSVSVSPRGSEHGFSASSLSKSRRRRERQERREGRLRRFKDKIAMMFHHRHDHHHHHHIENHRRPGGSKEVEGRRLKSPSPWKYLGLGGMFHRGDRDGEKKKAKKKTKTTSRTVVTVPGKKPGRGGGGGNAQSLFDALVKHKMGARKEPAAPARARMVRGGSMSRVQVKKMHWWERLRRQRRGRGEVAGSSRPRRRLGQGKAL